MAVVVPLGIELAVFSVCFSVELEADVLCTFFVVPVGKPGGGVLCSISVVL